MPLKGFQGYGPHSAEDAVQAAPLAWFRGTWTEDTNTTSAVHVYVRPWKTSRYAVTR
jgi:hypothetical protein